MFHDVCMYVDDVGRRVRPWWLGNVARSGGTPHEEVLAPPKEGRLGVSWCVGIGVTARSVTEQR